MKQVGIVQVDTYVTFQSKTAERAINFCIFRNISFRKNIIFGKYINAVLWSFKAAASPVI